MIWMLFPLSLIALMALSCGQQGPLQRPGETRLDSAAMVSRPAGQREVIDLQNQTGSERASPDSGLHPQE